MAWHIPQELMNNNPLSKNEVEERYKKYGYKILNYNYKNSYTRMVCEDSEGYRVKISLTSLGKVKTYNRFSTTCNKENFIYNVNLYSKKNNLPSKVINYFPSKTKNHINVECLCDCGNIFICDFNNWRRLSKTRCNKCTSHMSNIEYLTKLWLENNNIKYISQFRFDDCRDKRPLPFDFYIPSMNVCIEVDGHQHFYKNCAEHFNKNNTEYIEIIKKHDEIKNEYCKNNNIDLIRLKYSDFEKKEKYKIILKNKFLC